MRGANRPRNNAASSLRARIATLALLFFSAGALFSLFAGISYAANRPTQMWITGTDTTGVTEKVLQADPEEALRLVSAIKDPGLIMAVVSEVATKKDPALAEEILNAHPEAQGYRFYQLNLAALRTEQERYQEAAELLMEVIKQNLKDKDQVHFAAANLRMLFAYFDNETALLPYFEYLYPSVSDNTGFLVEAQEAAAGGRRWDLVEKYIFRRVELDPNSITGREYFYLGLANDAQGKAPATSLDHYQKSVAMGYTSPRLYNNIAGNYIKLEKWNLAEEWAFKAYLADPKYFYPLFNLAYIHNVRGEYQEAKEWYEKALRVDPKNEDAKAEYEELLKKMGQAR